MHPFDCYSLTLPKINISVICRHSFEGHVNELFLMGRACIYFELLFQIFLKIDPTCGVDNKYWQKDKTK